ncbi:MAG: LysM peptidoglycan-binding domain-containing protein [Gammaproteobacteria bacterium]|jgi:LysM repeat protein|nr:LysM peptidoglycan-binding domain-containing protein [Gammaproteobacteria bacterium]
MKRLSDLTKLVVLGGLVAVFTAGCAAKKAPQVETAKAGPAVAPAAAAANDSHTVARGEHLWGISSLSQIYGDPYHWPRLYLANADQIKDADLIYPGQVLTVSRNDSADTISRSVRHAKTRGPWQLGVVEQSDVNFKNGG